MYHQLQLDRLFWLVKYVLVLMITRLVVSNSAIQPSNSSSYKFPKFLYDDSYLINQLDSRFPYLKLEQNSTEYIGPRDYFNFTDVFEPSKEYYDRVNIEDRLFEELKLLEIGGTITTMDQWYYSEAEQEVSLSRVVSNEKQCKYQLDRLESELKRAESPENNFTNLFQPGLRNIQLLRLMDSWGRPPSETYHGHSYWMGSYRACRMAELSDYVSSSSNFTLSTDEHNSHSEVSSTTFRYCWAKLTAKSWPKNDQIIPPTNFRVGICLPDSCNGRLAIKFKSQILRLIHFNFSPLHRSRFNRIIHIYCLPNKNGLTFQAKLFLTIAASWISLILGLSLLASVYENKKRQLPVILKILTLQQNFSRFSSNDCPPTSQQNYVDLRPIGLFRFFASLGICIAHSGCAFGWSFTSSTFAIQSYQDISYYFMCSLFKSVDIFLVLGGMTTSYTIIGKFQAPKQKLSSILKARVYIALNVARYLRLAPMLILSIAFMKTVYIHLADSPNWDYGTYNLSIQGQCQRSSWWRALAFPILVGFRGNSFFNECLAISWYLITDMKLALIAPILIYLISRPKASDTQRFLIILMAILLSTASQFIGLLAQRLIYLQQFITYGLAGINILHLTFGETGYYSAINRLHSFAVGLLAGHYLRAYQKGTNLKEWPSWMRGVYFGALFTWQFYDFFTPHITQYSYNTYKQLPSENAIMLATLLKPRIDAIMFAIIILRTVTDLAPKLMENSMPLYKLSKLSYCVFLIHSIVISYIVTVDEKSRLDSLFSQHLKTDVLVVSLSYLISFPVYLVFESPLAQLTTILFKQKSDQLLQQTHRHLSSSSSSSSKQVKVFKHSSVNNE